jgi:G:T/U-mismatch repair DNA glycosylase
MKDLAAAFSAVADEVATADSAIRDAVINPLDEVVHRLPQLRRVFFNGATAARGRRWFADRGYEVAVLPSSSPAYTIGFEAKRAAWMAIASRSAAGRIEADHRDAANVHAVRAC